MKTTFKSRRRGLQALGVAVAVCICGVGVAIAVDPGDESPPGSASIGLFQRAQRASERGLLPSSAAIPGREEFGADPTKARGVDTGENGPKVIAYPGRTGACIAVLFDNGAGGQGASYACKPYAEIEKGTWLVTLESDEADAATQYVGLLPDGYGDVRVGGGNAHRVVENMFSFTERGRRADATSRAPDGSRKPLG